MLNLIVWFVVILPTVNSQPAKDGKPCAMRHFKRISEGNQALHPSDLISNHTIHRLGECHILCISQDDCNGYNYRVRPSNLYTANCQLSNSTVKMNKTNMKNGPWIFYEDVLVKEVPCIDPKPLGMQIGKIPNSAITASSTIGKRKYYNPYFARLNKTGISCCWAPARNVGSWLQVDLGKKTAVTGFATQGTCYHGHEWAISYSIAYSNNGNNWTDYIETGTVKVFQGNKDQNSIVTHTFKNEIVARYIRVLPKSWRAYPSMRLELYGCH